MQPFSINVGIYPEYNLAKPTKLTSPITRVALWDILNKGFNIFPSN
jgi:hypothetical protein